jgi:hypothetical protein
MADTVWVNMVLNEANLVLTEPKELMSALFNVDRNISWEDNLHNALAKLVRRIGVIDLAGRDLDLTVSGVRLNAFHQTDMIGFITDTV